MNKEKEELPEDVIVSDEGSDIPEPPRPKPTPPIKPPIE